MYSHLLATKLRPPAIPPKRTPRFHLVRRLQEGLEAGRQITLLSAPAGFGKTVCARLTYQQIADRLFISLNTVHSHVLA